MRVGLAIAAATTAVFVDRAAQEQRSTFYTAGAAELYMYELRNYK